MQIRFFSVASMVVTRIFTSVSGLQLRFSQLQVELQRELQLRLFLVTSKVAIYIFLVTSETSTEIFLVISELEFIFQWTFVGLGWLSPLFS
jgi:hypothetical protein